MMRGVSLCTKGGLQVGHCSGQGEQNSWPVVNDWCNIVSCLVAQSSKTGRRMQHGQKRIIEHFNCTWGERSKPGQWSHLVGTTGLVGCHLHSSDVRSQVIG